MFMLKLIFQNWPKARKCNIWVFYQLVFSYENGENSLELPIMIYKILISLKNEQLLL